MKSITRFTALLISLTLLLSACASQQPAATQSPSEEPTEASAPVDPTEVSAPVDPTEEPTDVPEPVFTPGMVTTTENDGEGSLRQMIDAAQPGDVITFDPNVFRWMTRRLFMFPCRVQWIFLRVVSLWTLPTLASFWMAKAGRKLVFTLGPVIIKYTVLDLKISPYRGFW